MGELSWYHDRHGAYAEVWGPETFAAPRKWRERARRLQSEAAPEVILVIPHPHDVLFAKLERMDDSDVDHLRRILAEFPLAPESLETLAREAPYSTGEIVDPERVARFGMGLERLRNMLESPGGT